MGSSRDIFIIRWTFKSRFEVVLFYGRDEDVESFTPSQMSEFGLSKILSDPYAPETIIADLTKMSGGNPEIYQALGQLKRCPLGYIR